VYRSPDAEDQDLRVDIKIKFICKLVVKQYKTMSDSLNLESDQESEEQEGPGRKRKRTDPQEDIFLTEMVRGFSSRAKRLKVGESTLDKPVV
jgi:hypothetical protein